MLGKLRYQFRSLPDFKIGKIETRGYGASHERPGFPAGYMRAEPAAGGHHSLRDLAFFRIISEESTEYTPAGSITWTRSGDPA